MILPSNLLFTNIFWLRDVETEAEKGLDTFFKLGFEKSDWGLFA